jgi:TatD DNase family protein
MRFVDIGANLMDERFTEGSYNGKKKHEPDWEAVMERAASVGVTHIILTAGTLTESKRALELVRKLRRDQDSSSSSSSSSSRIRFGCTVGIHPTRCQQEFVDSEMEAEQVLEHLAQLIQDGATDGSGTL